MENKRCALRGVVTRRLYDADGNPLKMFQENKFWEFLREKLNWDLKIPFVTGRWTYDPIVHNAITNIGLARIAGLIVGEEVSGSPISPFEYLAIGQGMATASGLQTEIVSGGGQRAKGTVRTTTTTISNDTAEVKHEWEFSDSFAITEEGWFNAAVSGDLLAFRNFSAVNVSSGNKFEVTHQIVVAEDIEE